MTPDTVVIARRSRTVRVSKEAINQNTFETREEIAGDMISSAYGKGFMGELSDGTRVVVRRESETGGPTVEIQVKNCLHKYRY
jgi:hypothetical protein